MFASPDVAKTLKEEEEDEGGEGRKKKKVFCELR